MTTAPLSLALVAQALTGVEGAGMTTAEGIAIACAVDQRCQRTANGSPPRAELPEKTPYPYFRKSRIKPQSCSGGRSSVRFTSDSIRIADISKGRICAN